MNVLEPVPGDAAMSGQATRRADPRGMCERLTQLLEAEQAAAVDFCTVFHEN